MHFMARRARDLILGVAALQPADVGRIVQVTGKADLVRRRGSQLRWIANIVGRGGFGVLLRGPMAGFARPPLPTALLVGVLYMMRTLGEGDRNVFVTGR